MPYDFIATFGIDPKNQTFKAVNQSVTEETFNRFRHLTSRLKYFENAESQFLIFGINCQAADQYISKHITPSNIESTNRELKDVIIYANAFTIGFLSTFTLFLDNTRSRLIRLYGKKNEILELYNQHRETEYANNFPYRLSYYLRNYLHVGLPINHIIYSWEEDKSDEGAYSYKIGIDPKELLNSLFTWKPDIRKELELLEDYLPAQPIFRSVWESISRIYTGVKEKEMVILRDDAEEIRTMMSEIIQLGLTVPSMGKIEKKNGIESFGHIVHAPLSAMELVGVKI